MARAIATRCCSPPLSLTGGNWARFFEPDDLQVHAVPLRSPRPNRGAAESAESPRSRPWSGAGTGDNPGTRIRSCAAGTRRARRCGRLQMSVPSILTRAAIGAQDAGDHAEHRGLAAAGRPDDVKHLAEIGLEAHVLTAMRPGLALAEPFVEAPAWIATSAIAQPRKMSKGSIFEHLAHAEVAGDRRR